MTENDVVRMVNQIAQFFAPYPETDAVDGIHDHMLKFWPPVMRRELAALVHAPAGAPSVLHPLALLAAQRLDAPGSA
jgi:formate dehydrogenase subunit delta